MLISVYMDFICAYSAYRYIYTAWASVLSVLQVWAVPEPQLAEQQYCSPAFCLSMCLNKRMCVEVRLMVKQAWNRERVWRLELSATTYILQETVKSVNNDNAKNI